jgi:hypothetical protein
MIVNVRGKPQVIVSETGIEFTSNAMMSLGQGSSCGLALHRAGQIDAERLHRVLQRPEADELAMRACLSISIRRGPLVGAWVADYTARPQFLARLKTSAASTLIAPRGVILAIGRGSSRWMKVQ